MDDGAIVARYWSRNESAIAETDRKYGPYCRVIALNILGSREDAEECVSDTWHSAWNSMPPQRPGSLSAFLGRIVRNLSISRWRRERAQKRYNGVDSLLSDLEDCLLDTGLVLDNPEERHDLHRLEEPHFESMERVFYLETQITIPAGESVTVEASFLKEASFDYACTRTQDTGVYGCDLVTKLGSNLDFTSQTARAENTQGVEIVRQNFGFDWANSVDTVALTPGEEHYYLEVRRAEEP